MRHGRRVQSRAAFEACAEEVRCARRMLANQPRIHRLRKRISGERRNCWPIGWAPMRVPTRRNRASELLETGDRAGHALWAEIIRALDRLVLPPKGSPD